MTTGTACSEGTGPPNLSDTPLELALVNLQKLDPATEGTYEAWIIGSDGTIYSAGRFELPDGGRVTLTSRLENPEHLMITVEPPGDEDDAPSGHKLVGAKFDGLTATLDLNHYVTAGIPLEPSPGTHVLFTPSDNAELGYPSYEDAGIWVFNIHGDTLDGSFYIKLTPLTEGWSYEGWMVYDYGTPNAVWASYGKFKADPFRRVKGRDDTGLGPYSGQLDYRYAMPQEVVMPGDDWVSNPFNLPVPGGFTLPFDLNGDASQGIKSRWTHVITIEPWGPNRDPEMPHQAQPFFLEPYRNPIGEATVEQPRTIEYHPERLPSGTATLKPAQQ